MHMLAMGIDAIAGAMLALWVVASLAHINR